MDFGSRLKYLREERGLTQKQFVEEFNNYHTKDNIGDDANIYIQTVSYWEHGREANYNVLIKLSHFFNVSLDYLIGNSDIKDLKEYEYMSNIKELNKENIIKVIEAFTDSEKAEFYDFISRYIYNLRLNTALIENRSLDINDLNYIKYLSDITTIIDEYSENIFNLFIEFNDEIPNLKNQLSTNEFNQLSENHTNTLNKITNVLNSIQKLCVNVAANSEDIQLKE
ncbi:MAG TPA: hypothetical protein DG753_11015 [Clostridium sp.]|nr:hypothetical protein [Clostridium sp.]